MAADAGILLVLAVHHGHAFRGSSSLMCRSSHAIARVGYLLLHGNRIEIRRIQLDGHIHAASRARLERASSNASRGVSPPRPQPGKCLNPFGDFLDPFNGTVSFLMHGYFHYTREENSLPVCQLPVGLPVNLLPGAGLNRALANWQPATGNRQLATGLQWVRGAYMPRLLLLLLLGSVAATAARKRVLYLTHSAGFRHASCLLPVP